MKKFLEILQKKEKKAEKTESLKHDAKCVKAFITFGGNLEIVGQKSC